TIRDRNGTGVQTSALPISQGLSSIISDKRVDEVKSFSLYGLSDPAYTLTVKTADKSWEISIGDESFSDGEVYISTGDEYVYLTRSEERRVGTGRTDLAWTA